MIKKPWEDKMLKTIKEDEVKKASSRQEFYDIVDENSTQKGQKNQKLKKDKEKLFKKILNGFIWPVRSGKLVGRITNLKKKLTQDSEDISDEELDRIFEELLEKEIQEEIHEKEIEVFLARMSSSQRMFMRKVMESVAQKAKYQRTSERNLDREVGGAEVNYDKQRDVALAKLNAQKVSEKLDELGSKNGLKETSQSKSAQKERIENVRDNGVNRAIESTGVTKKLSRNLIKKIVLLAKKEGPGFVNLLPKELRENQTVQKISQKLLESSTEKPKGAEEGLLGRKHVGVMQDIKLDTAPKQNSWQSGLEHKAKIGDQGKSGGFGL